MQVTVTFRHTEPTEALKSYAEEKIKKIEKFLNSPQEAHVVLSVEKIRHIAEVFITADGLTITGKEETSDLYSAIDKVMDKIERQLKRQKDKRRTRKSGQSIRTREHGKKLTEVLATVEEVPTEKEKKDKKTRIIPTNNFLPKPMTVEDAVIELMSRSDGVVVFRNSTNMNICVLHLRKDGNIGLIETPPAK